MTPRIDLLKGSDEGLLPVKTDLISWESRSRVENPTLLGYSGRTLEGYHAEAHFFNHGRSSFDSCPEKTRRKKVVLVDAAEYAALKRRLAEVSDALEKISRGDAAYRQGRTKTVSSLAELRR